MLDLALVVTIVVFFAVAFAYARGCDRLGGGHAMTFDAVVAFTVALGLGVYLVYALLRPERF